MIHVNRADSDYSYKLELFHQNAGQSYNIKVVNISLRTLYCTNVRTAVTTQSYINEEIRVRVNS